MIVLWQRWMRDNMMRLRSQLAFHLRHSLSAIQFLTFEIAPQNPTVTRKCIHLMFSPQVDLLSRKSFLVEAA